MRHIAVAGAGIGGLAAGLALAQAGCRVTIFERTPLLAEVGAGLQLSPNATRILRQFGVLKAIERDAVALRSLCIGRGRDGRTLARLPLGPEAERRFGAPFLVALRADLHGALLAGIDQQPHVRIETGRSLARWSALDRGLRLEFEGAGPAIDVDALVGCDGLHSVVRDRLGIGASPERRKGRTAWRATIEASAAPAAFREPNSHLWLGRKAHLVHYPVANGHLVNIVAAVDASPSDQPGTALWSTPGDPAELGRRFALWADPIRQLLSVPRAWGTWPLIDRPPLPRWSHGLVTLLGDAAHPMLPFLAQGAAQAIEDAAALGNAVHDHPSDLAAAFQAYEAARRPRATRVQAESRRQAMIYHLPGPASAARDLVLCLSPPSRLLARYDWLYGT